MPTYDYTCRKCETSWDAFVRYEDRETQTCALCGSLDVFRHFPAPALMQASFPDGTKRKGFAEAKEAVKLQREAAVTRKQDTKREILREVQKIRSIKK